LIKNGEYYSLKPSLFESGNSDFSSSPALSRCRRTLHTVGFGALMVLLFITAKAFLALYKSVLVNKENGKKDSIADG